jgi:protein-tyrosine phosphatase
LPGKVISSAGLGALKEKGVDPSAALVLVEQGYVAEGHRARQVTSRMLIDADLVLVMEKAHQRTLMDRYPFLSGKVMLLGHWSNTEINDPYRKSSEAFAFIFQQIDKSCSEWVARIDG